MNGVPTELLLMLLGDARLPVAGHTQSAVLEGAVQHGLTGDQVPSYVAARLGSVVRVEAGTAVAGSHALRAGEPLRPVVAAWAARTPSAVQRRASRTQGRAFLRIAGRLWPDSEFVAAVAATDAPPRPLAVAAAAATLDLPPRSLAHLIGYDDVQTVASAALKLLPLDPATAVEWVHDALASIAALAEDIARVRGPDDIPALAAPQTELWAETHARSNRRLFSA